MTLEQLSKFIFGLFNQTYKHPQNEVRVTASGVSVVKFNPVLVKQEIEKMRKK